MPVEIRELHIKVAINEQERDINLPPSDSWRSKDEDSSADTEAIIAQCVEQVMALLRKQKER